MLIGELGTDIQLTDLAVDAQAISINKERMLAC